MAFDTLKGARRLRSGGADEPLAEAVVEVVADATADLVTRDFLDSRLEAFRSEMYRAFAIQTGVILGGVGALLAIVETVA